MTDHELLELAPDATHEDLKHRWRELAQVHHPDHGGDPDTFQRLRAAYERLAQELSQPTKPCPACAGRGTRQVQRGLFTVAVGCETCGGTKEVAR